MMGGSRLPRRHTTLLNVTEPSNVIGTATTDQSCDVANVMHASPEEMAANGSYNAQQLSNQCIQKSKSLMPAQLQA